MRFLKERAADLLETVGLRIEPHHISPALGHWRTSPYADAYRWEADGRGRLGHPVCVGCWQTLTDFVRLGRKFGVVYDEKEGEVWANEEPHKDE